MLYPSSDHLTTLARLIRRGSVFYKHIPDVNFLAKFLHDRLGNENKRYRKLTDFQLDTLIAAAQTVPTGISLFTQQQKDEVTISFHDRPPVTVEIVDSTEADAISDESEIGWKVLYACADGYAVLGSSNERDFPIDKPYYFLTGDEMPDKDSNIFLGENTVYFILRTWEDVTALLSRLTNKYRKLEVDI